MDNLKEHIDNVDRAIDTILHSDLIVHVIMLGAALASLNNVWSFFSTDHSGVVATTLAIILGLVLVVMSSKLSRLPINWADRDYQITAATTIAFGMISGAVQTAIYRVHMDGMAAGALGFGLPLGFEVCLAFAVASYKRSLRAVAANDSRNRLADAMAEKFNVAIDSVDSDGMTTQFQTMANNIAREAALTLECQMIADMRNGNKVPSVAAEQNDGSLLDVTIDDALGDDGQKDAQSPQIDYANTPHFDELAGDLTIANDQRQSLVDQRRDAVLAIVKRSSIGVAGIIEQLPIMYDGVSRNTIVNDLKALAKDEHVYNADKQWHPTIAIDPLPTVNPLPVTISTNGNL